MFTAVGMPLSQAEQIAACLEEVAGRACDSPRQRQRMISALGKLRASLHNPRSTPLPPGWDLSNGTKYRAAFLRATNDEGVRRSRRTIQQLLGVSNGSVGEMVRLAGLAPAVEGGEFQEAPLKQVQDIEQQVQQTARQLRGYPKALVVETAQGETVSSGYKGKESVAYIEAQMARGAQVNVQYQVANRYIELEAVPPASQVAAKASQPTTRERKAKPQRTYGPRHDPQWVYEQVALLLVRRGRLCYDKTHGYYDPHTGEILPGGDVRALLRLARVT